MITYTNVKRHTYECISYNAKYGNTTGTITLWIDRRTPCPEVLRPCLREVALPCRHSVSTSAPQRSCAWCPTNDQFTCSWGGSIISGPMCSWFPFIYIFCCRSSSPNSKHHFYPCQFTTLLPTWTSKDWWEAFELDQMDDTHNLTKVLQSNHVDPLTNGYGSSKPAREQANKTFTRILRGWCLCV